jgi:hypothetical protein
VRRSLLLLMMACLASSGVALADDHDGGGRAFVEVVAARETVYVHEPIRLQLRVGYDAAFFRASAIPLFRQRLDVPAMVEAPWMGELAGTTALDLTPTEAARVRTRQRLALNGDAVEAVVRDDVERDGTTFTVLEFERRVEADGPGDITVSAPTLRFAYGSRFDDDLVGGRVAADRQDAIVRGAPLTLHVVALPAEGRPPEFRDAVGRFTVQATADRNALEVGAIVRVTLRIEGEGNLERLESPRLDGLAGFQSTVRSTTRDSYGARSSTTSRPCATTCERSLRSPSRSLTRTRRQGIASRIRWRSRSLCGRNPALRACLRRRAGPQPRRRRTSGNRARGSWSWWAACSSP